MWLSYVACSLHPLKGNSLIKQPLVAGHSVRPQGQPTKDVQPKLHCHKYDIPVQQATGSVCVVRCIRQYEGSSVKKDHHGKETGIVSHLGNVDIEVEAVLFSQINA